MKSPEVKAMAQLKTLKHIDPELAELIQKEEERQELSIRLIPSENYTSHAVMEATGSILTNKYSEGYPGMRYYEGQDFIDRIEQLAIDRAKALFGAEHANVQPYSGSPANQAVYMAILKPGDKVMGLSLPFGGHLTHGWKVNFSGITYNAVQYEVDPQTHLIDLDRVADLARREQPKLLFTGGTAYPRIWDFEGFARIAREIGAVLVADIAHISGLVAGGAHPSPLPHAEIVTTTTHKTLRGPRGGMILCTKEYQKRIDRAVFPGLQGGPHNHTTAGIAVALAEAATPEFKAYAHQIVRNARALAGELNALGFRLVSNGTDNHLILIDTTVGAGDRPGMSGKPAAKALAKAGIECNYNTIPFDPRKPMDPSGVRIGTPSITTRGMVEAHMKSIAEWMHQALCQAGDEGALAKLRATVAEFCRQFPAPGIRV